MAEDKQDADQPTQETPKGHKIPVPTRGQVFRDLEKVARGQRRPSRKAPSVRKAQQPPEPS